MKNKLFNFCFPFLILRLGIWGLGLLFFFLFLGNISIAQNIGINTTGAAPASTNMLEVLQPTTTDNTIGIYVNHSGAISGTGYAFQAIKDGASINNVAAYLSASGATNNYALIIPSGGGNVGIGTSAPGFQLDMTQTLRVQGNAIYGGPTGDPQFFFYNNGGFRLDLDEDNDGSETFGIRDGSDNIVFEVDENGNSDIDGNITLLANKSITTGNNFSISTGSGFDLTGAASVALTIDNDNNGSGSTFTVKHDAGTELFKVAESGVVTVAGLAGGGVVNLTVNNTGQLVAGSTDIGDVTDITAGNGLTGGGTTGSITVNAVGDNGLTTNADDIDLGGSLNQSTTITQGANAFTIANSGTANTTINLSSTGDFDVQDNGSSALFVKDDATVGIGTNVTDANYQLTVERPGDNNFAYLGGDLFGIYTTVNAGTENGLYSLHSSSSTTASYYSILGEVSNSAYTSSQGYLGYHNTGNNTYSFYGTGGTFGGYFQNNVGIATTTPAMKLDVRGGNSTATTAAFENIFQVGSTSSSPLALRMGLKTDATAASRYGAIEVDDNGTARNLSLQPTNGNVGVGTTDPAAKLQIIDGTANDKGLSLRESSTANEIFFVPKLGGGGYNPMSIAGDMGLFFRDDNTVEGGALVIGQWSASSKGIRIDATGNVGIGSNSPGGKLDVFGSIKQSAANPTTILFHNTNESGTPSGSDGFRIRYEDAFFGGSNDALIFEKTDGNEAVPDGGASGIAFVNTGNDGTVTPAMSIKGNGNVGIGTTDPSGILHTIASGAKTAAFSGNLFTNTATSGTASIIKAGTEIKSTGTWNGTSASNIGLYVSTVTGGTKNYDAVFNGGGNVGIGTTDPNYALDVVGYVGATNQISTIPLWQAGSNYAMSNTSGADLSNCESGIDPSLYDPNGNIEVRLVIRYTSLTGGTNNFQLRAHNGTTESYPIVTGDAWTYATTQTGGVAISPWKDWTAGTSALEIHLHGWVTSGTTNFNSAYLLVRPNR